MVSLISNASIFKLLKIPILLLKYDLLFLLLLNKIIINFVYYTFYKIINIYIFNTWI